MTKCLRLGFAALACTLALPASAELASHKDLSYDIAKTMAEGADRRLQDARLWHFRGGGRSRRPDADRHARRQG